MPQSSIARWEVDKVEPGLSTLRRVLQALRLRPLPDAGPVRARPGTRRTRARGAAAHTAGTAARPARPDRERMSPARFDPYAILHALEQEGVNYVIVGGLARVLQGSDELTHGIDVAPSPSAKNLERLQSRTRASSTPAASTATRSNSPTLDTDRDPVVELASDAGEIKVVLEPAGTRGYDDLRHRATREPIGEGLRPARRRPRRPRPHARSPRPRAGPRRDRNHAARDRARPRPRLGTLKRGLSIERWGSGDLRPIETANAPGRPNAPASAIRSAARRAPPPGDRSSQARRAGTDGSR